MGEHTALVTGATSGIGTHIARQLAERGWSVLVGARDRERGGAVATEIGGRVVQLDVTDARPPRALRRAFRSWTSWPTTRGCRSTPARSTGARGAIRTSTTGVRPRARAPRTVRPRRPPTLTVFYAHALAADGVKVNALALGVRATNLNPRARSAGGDPAEAAAGAVRLALLPDGGPTGQLFLWDGAVAPW